MRNLHFIGGEKGGVGKSLTARALAQYLIDQQQDFIGFDGDQSHGTFSRFYQEFSSDLVIDDFESLDKLFETAETEPEKDILVDLAAQSQRKLWQWVEDSDAIDLFSSLGVNTYFWHVMDDGADSLKLLENAIEDCAEHALKMVVVKNYGRGDDFSVFEASDLAKKLAESGSSILEIPQLQSKIAQKMDFTNQSFWAAANNRTALSLPERQRVRVWLKKVYAEFDGLFQTVEMPAFV